MSLSPQEITIAITVYSRRQYIERAVESALNQTIPVKVIVVEDCGPDLQLQEFVKQRFGSRIEYFRNPQRRGLFDNWNACMEYCQTPWISILHDDDYLAPNFVETMLELHGSAPECGLYFGETDLVGDNGKLMLNITASPMKTRWRRVELIDGVKLTPFPFPGQLFKIDQAKALGGFRKTSLYCGDWEMWMNLIAVHGSAQISERVAFQLQHSGWDRGTNRVIRSGWLYALTYVQHKRNLKLLATNGIHLRFDRLAFQKWAPLPTRFLLTYGHTLRRRILAYNVKLLLLSTAPHWKYKVFQKLTQIGGVSFVKFASYLWALPRLLKKKSQ